jgi:phosphate/sulfate permease
MTFFLLVLLAALVFEYINGFHDAANAIATVVSTKVMTPRQALAMAAFFNLLGALWGTAAGGWRIIRTMGHKMVKLQPVHGFAAETTAAVIIQTATHYGIPLSTTHVISTSIMGVGATKRFSAVKWGVVSRILWAWVLTIPVTALLGWASHQVIGLAFGP